MNDDGTKGGALVDYARPQTLIGTDEVATRLGDADLHLVEVDEDTEAYTRGHLPGAVEINWRTDLQHRNARDVVDKAGFEALMGSRGITEKDEVVLYSGNNNWFAAYALWYLKYYGHERVRLMDGGRKKWELEDRPLTTEAPAIVPAVYHAQAPDEAIRARRDEVISRIGRSPMIDVRSPEEFTGILAAPAHLPQEVAQRSGRIPHATNVPWSRAANDDGSFRSADELRALYLGQAGLKADDDVIVYCRIGERSSHTWVVLHELLGFENVKNYDGSWTEYGSLVGAPLETGEPA